MSGFLQAAGGLLLATAVFVAPIRAQVQTPPSGIRPAAPPAPRVLPGTRANAFGMIQGNALTSTNGILPEAPVRLRDARNGRILDVQRTDRAGLFAFKNIDPGTYVVELVSEDEQAVLSASELLQVNAGDAVSAIVKLPLRVPPIAGISHSLTTAAAIGAAAASAGVLATKVTGRNISPE